MSAIRERPWLATPADTMVHLSGGTRVMAPHIEVMSDTIARGVVAGGMRLLLEMPPRHGKTEIASRWTPSWFLGLWPEKRCILTSYEADFAAQHGRVVRDILSEHGTELDVALDERTVAAHRWNTAAGGGMQTSGVGGPITGKGADLMIIDDPVKNDEEALSETRRERIWNWYQTTVRSRIEPRGSLVVIMTRWHQADLIGRLLQQQEEVPGADRWTRIRFPAICETPSWWDHRTQGEYVDELGRRDGDPLWPERYPRAELEKIKAGMLTHWWSAMYQQSPIPIGDAMLRPEWFQRTNVPNSDKALRCRMWDLAGSSRKNSDWTVGALVSCDRSTGRIVIEDLIRVRLQPGDVERLVLATAQQDGLAVKVRVQKDPGQAGKAQIDHYVRLLLGYDIDGYALTGPKVVRAGPLASQAQHGNVFLLAGAWVPGFLAEASVFPHGRFDDQVDAASAALDVVAGGRRRVFGHPGHEMVMLDGGRRDAAWSSFEASIKRNPREVLEQW